MKRKLKLVIFDNDKQVTTKKYPISDSGDRVLVTKGGEAHFMPQFDHNSYLELPKPWYKGGGTERTYFVRKLAKKCIDFQTGVVEGPDPQQVMDAAGATILSRFGVDKQVTSLREYIVAGLVFLTFLKVIGVIP